jgi:hypothetical protein
VWGYTPYVHVKNRMHNVPEHNGRMHKVPEHNGMHKAQKHKFPHDSEVRDIRRCDRTDVIVRYNKGKGITVGKKIKCAGTSTKYQKKKKIKTNK